MQHDGQGRGVVACKPQPIRVFVPTAYLLFFALVGKTSKSAKHVCGHPRLLLLAPECSPSARIRRSSGPKILAAVSLSATGTFMVLLDLSHPPAGATTLIVSLGIISKPRELVIIKVAVLLLVIQAFVINRVAGIALPFSIVVYLQKAQT